MNIKSHNKNEVHRIHLHNAKVHPTKEY